MSSKLKYYQNWNVTKTDMSPKLKCHQNWNFTKTKVSPKLNCHQNWNFIKTELSLKLNCYQNWNVTKHNNVPKSRNQNSRDWHWSPWSFYYDKGFCRTAPATPGLLITCRRKNSNFQVNLSMDSAFDYIILLNTFCVCFLSNFKLSLKPCGLIFDNVIVVKRPGVSSTEWPFFVGKDNILCTIINNADVGNNKNVLSCQRKSCSSCKNSNFVPQTNVNLLENNFPSDTVFP